MEPAGLPATLKVVAAEDSAIRVWHSCAAAVSLELRSVPPVGALNVKLPPVRCIPTAHTSTSELALMVDMVCDAVLPVPEFVAELPVIPVQFVQAAAHLEIR